MEILDFKTGLESYLREKGAVIAGQPRIKATHPLGIPAIHLVRIAEFLVSPPGNGLYQIEKLNQYLDFLLPSEEMVKRRFGAEGFVRLRKGPFKLEPAVNNGNYLRIGRFSLEYLISKERTKINFIKGELLQSWLDNNTQFEEVEGSIDVNSVRYLGLVLVYPDERIARVSYIKAGMTEPLTEISF